MRITCKLVLVLVILRAAVANADDPPPPQPKPWAVGVSESEQALALQLYEQGNAEFQAARFAQALAKYLEALQHWDHPSIHFNATVCLINLDQPIEAKKHLDRALSYGPDAIGPEMYSQGLTYQHSLDGQIARVKITCGEPGASITLDGKYLFTGPGDHEVMVLPGTHQIVASKRGYLTRSESLQLAPSRVTKYDVHLVAFKTTRYERRWATWKPLAVLGGGLVAAGLGGIAYAIARHEFHEYDAAVTKECPHGCDAATNAMLGDVHDFEHRGEAARGISYALFAIGGATVLTGAVGVVLNQPRALPDNAPAEHTGREMVVTWRASW